MTCDDLLAHMRRLDACSSAIHWAESQDGSAYDLWRRCDRGDWLLWFAARVDVDRRLVVLAACDCVEPALVHMPAGEERPRLIIETTRRWARDEATIKEVRATNTTSTAAAVSYSASCAAHAATAAAGAAAASYSAPYSASCAASCAAHAAAAAAASSFVEDGPVLAAWAGSHMRALAESARLVRQRIPWSAVCDALSVL